MARRSDFLRFLTSNDFLTKPLKLDLATTALKLLNAFSGLLDMAWSKLAMSLHAPQWLLHIPHNIAASKFWSEHLTIDFHSTPLQLFLGFNAPHDAASLKRYFEFADTLNIQLALTAAFLAAAVMFFLLGYLMNADLVGAYERALTERAMSKLERLETSLAHLESRL
jgi:hypothetical protein